MKKITREDALRLLLEVDELSYEEVSNDNETIFDAYGNYNFPFDAKIKEPNIAVGCVFAKATTVIK